jgi:hypothetical protein
MWPFRRKKVAQIPRASTVITLPGSPLRITLCDAAYFTEREMGKLMDAICILSYVMNSDEFRERVLGATFSTTKLSNSSIYKIIMNANEALDGVADTFGMDHGDDNEMDLVLSIYSSRFSRVIGYVLPESIRIYINRKFFSYFKPWNVAGNLAHEGTHLLGFGHTSVSDSESVPYLIGDIVAELGEKCFTEATQRRLLIETHIRVGGI